MADIKPLSIAIDRAELLQLLETRLSTAPETFDQVFRLFFDENAPLKADTLLDYLVVVSDGEAPRTNNVVGFRVRDTDEFVSAIGALYAENFVSISHTSSPAVAHP